MNRMLFFTSFLLFLISAQAVKFPVPDAQTEFDAAVIKVSKAYSLNKSNLAEAIKPYSFGSLNILKPTNYDDSEALINMFYGVIATLSGVKGKDIHKSMDDFQCGEVCMIKRRDILKNQISELKKISEDFLKLNTVHLLSVWEGPYQGLRINQVFSVKSLIWEETPSEKFGLIPSSKSQKLKSIQEYFSSLKVSEKSINGLAEQLRKLDLHAVLTDELGTRVVTNDSRTDNHAGVIFSKIPPAFAQKTKDGLKISAVEKIAPDLYFYQTN